MMAKRTLFARTRRWAVAHPVLACFLIALTARLVTAFVATVVLDNALLSPDSNGYQSMLGQAANGTTSGWDDFTRDFYGSMATFTIPLTVLYRILAPSQIYGQIFVGVIGAGVAALTTRLALQVLPRAWSLGAGLCVGLLPSQVFFSSSILKDPFVWIAGAALGVSVALMNRVKNIPSLLSTAALVAAPLILMAYARIHSFVIACFAVLIAGWLGRSEMRLPRGLIATSIAVMVPWLVGVGPLGYDFISQSNDLSQMRQLNALGAASAFIAPTREQEELSAQAEELFNEAQALRDQAKQTESEAAAKAGGSSGSPPTGSSGSPPTGSASPEPPPEAARLRKQAEDLEAQARLLAAQATGTLPESTGDSQLEPSLSYLPKGLLIVFLRPFPLEGGSPSIRLAAAESLLWYPLVLLALVGLWAARRQLDAFAFPALYGLGMLLVLALAEGNIGSMFRHRGEVIWVIALFATLGLHDIIQRRGAQTH